MPKPAYQHHCIYCKYLGTHVEEGCYILPHKGSHKVDLYVCQYHRHGTTLIARHSSHPSTYESGSVSDALTSPMLALALVKHLSQSKFKAARDRTIKQLLVTERPQKND